MGFFSSLRGTDSTTNSSPNSNGDNSEKPVQKQKTVIRSRFYGSTRNKKAHVQEAERSVGIVKSVGGGVDEVPVAGPSRTTSVRAPSPPPPPPPPPPPASIHPPEPARPKTIHHSQSQTLPRARPPKANPAPAAHRASTTAVTTALAQRLAELAAANAAGLLDDDEYRLLRQNLFERVPGADAVPQEEPLVRIRAQPTTREQPSRPPSQFSSHTTAPSLAPTNRSRTSVTSAVGSLFRRATGRTSTGNRISVSVDDGDGPDFTDPSVTNGNGSNGWAGTMRGRLGARKTSESSLRDDAASTYSHSRRRPSAPPSAFNSPSTHHKPLPPPLTTSLSSGSIGRSPSTAHTGLPASSSAPVELAIERTNILDDALDDAHLKSSSAIRAEIAALEAEGRRVLGAFDGLELTALTRRAPRTPVTPSASASSSHAHRAGSIRRPTTPSASLHGHQPNTPSHPPRTPGSTRRAFPWPPEDDASSMKSGVSATSSRSRRAARTPRTPGGHGSSTLSTSASFPLLNSGVGASLSRRPSASSVSSNAHSLPSHGHGPSRLGRLAAAGGSSSSLNLRGSSAHLPLAPVRERDSTELPPSLSLDTTSSNDGVGLGLSPSSSEGGLRPGARRGEDGEDVEAAAREVADVRRRRAEVVGRYEERLEYLRAKLKGAELHEKLLRK